MAAATRKIPRSSIPPGRRPRPAMVDRLIRVVGASYRFLASVKLAVSSLGALAGTLAYATFFEKWYGTAAANECIYRGPYFAILLAFLGTNIACAALIRYPWKLRQTGFLITHAGLLTVLAGSYYSVRTSDEGRVGMLEGGVCNELVRPAHPVIRVWQVDADNQQYTREFDLPFRPGPFSWVAGNPQHAGLVGSLVSLIPFRGNRRADGLGETLTRSGQPFRVVAKEYAAASTPARIHVPAPDGTPMARIRLRFKTPGMSHEQEALPTEESQWFVPENRFHRVVRDPTRGAPAPVTFSVVDRPELVEDFLRPPATSGAIGVARFRYSDDSGNLRTFDWPLDGQDGNSVPLPNSDLTVTLTGAAEFTTRRAGLDQVLGVDSIPIALFEIRKAGEEPVRHVAMANMPTVPNVIPAPGLPAASPRRALAAIHYMVAPSIDPMKDGCPGQIDILALVDPVRPDRHQNLYYRVYGRGTEGDRCELRSAGPLHLGRPVVAFGGEPSTPMTISLSVDEYLPAGVERDIFVPVELPAGELDQGIAACRLEVTVGDETKEIWLRRSISLDRPRPEVVSFRDSAYALAFDADRKRLGFNVKLDDFEVGFEPGTQQPTKFESRVRLTDEVAGIRDEPHTIRMNHPLDHNGYSFYQTRYEPEIDPLTERPTGRFLSVFQVAINPGRPVIYAGCLLVVLGTFVQFYMRAGVFTDGGKDRRRPGEPRARAVATKAREAASSEPQELDP